MRAKRVWVLAALGLACLSAIGPAHPQAPLGVAVTPRNFPDHTAADLDDSFRLTRELGRHAVFIYQWGNIDLGVAKAMLAKAARSRLIAILGLSPTTLDQGRKELDLPAPLRAQARDHLSFSNPLIRRAYIELAMEIGRAHV